MNLRVFDRLRGHPDDATRRGELVVQTLPILLLPVAVGLAAGAMLILTGNVPPQPDRMDGSTPLIPFIPIVVMVTFSSSLVLLVRLGRPTLSALLMIGVWTLVMTLAALGGGIWSFIPALLLIPICAAGLLIDGVASISLAALATILVGSQGYMESQGLYTSSWPAPPLEQVPPTLFAVSFWSGLFWTVAALTSLLAGGLQRALQQSRAQAAALDELRSQLEVRVAEQTAELQTRAARAEALYDVTRALAGTLDLPQVLGLIAQQAARLLRFESSLVLLAQPDGTFIPGGLYNVPQRSAPTTTEYEAAQQQMRNLRAPTVVELPNTPSALALPLRYDDRTVGVLLLIAPDGQAERSADDLALAEGLASQAAVAISNAQFLEGAQEAAVLEERTRLARDIHDTLAQGLTGIVVMLGAAQRALAAAPDQAAEHLDLAGRMARESLAEARRSVWNMRAGALERGNLGDALQTLADQPLRPEIAVRFEQHGTPWPLSAGVESALLRIAQEALANVARHAGASAALVTLFYTDDAVALRIHDNGAGFDDAALRPRAAPAPWHGFGLLGMRERLAALGGTLTLRNNGGADVLATVPRPAAALPPVGSRQTEQV